MSDDVIPHGLKGYRMKCPCKVCRKAWADYCQERREARKANGTDQLAKKRAQKRTRTTRSRSKPAEPPTESRDSVGGMQAAVIEECATIDGVKPTQLVAAKTLARLVDSLTGQVAGQAVLNSSTKQLMALMAEIRGDSTQSKATGRRKSGGRLATVGELTKVKRRGA